jgi:hypothetical protein
MVGLRQKRLFADATGQIGDVALRGAALFSASVDVAKPPGQLPFKIPFSTVSDRSGDGTRLD